MQTTTVRYTVTPGAAGRNEDLIRRTYEDLHRTAPAGLRYATFVQEDGVSFVHLAMMETGEGQENPLMASPAFRTFLEGPGDRCVEPPVSAGLREVGSYRLGGG
ncbi:MAG: hypothetical protein ACR2OO_02715 [Thermomicrobiales bacterium]